MNPITDVIGAILKGPATAVVDYFKFKAELKSKERQAQLALTDAVSKRNCELATQGLTADMSWEMEFVKQAATSWKDEYTLLCVSLPLWMSFIPGLDVYVQHGFEALSRTPLWYQVMLQTMFYATVGVRMWRRHQSDT